MLKLPSLILTNGHYYYNVLRGLAHMGNLGRFLYFHQFALTYLTSYLYDPISHRQWPNHAIFSHPQPMDYPFHQIRLGGTKTD
ncbi:hypothetical protein SDC9_196421 [bioreactor metagenome]|uniref:Uncharacterized protein n=1 Tax=bioreactor metagenome TaxID=1076179 RepID=A0A645IED6_9ZZZZ